MFEQDMSVVGRYWRLEKEEGARRCSGEGAELPQAADSVV